MFPRVVRIVEMNVTQNRVVMYSQFLSSNQGPSKRKQSLAEHCRVSSPAAEAPHPGPAPALSTRSSHLKEARRLAGQPAGSLSPNAAG